MCLGGGRVWGRGEIVRAKSGLASGGTREGEGRGSAAGWGVRAPDGEDGHNPPSNINPGPGGITRRYPGAPATPAVSGWVRRLGYRAHPPRMPSVVDACLPPPAPGTWRLRTPRVKG